MPKNQSDAGTKKNHTVLIVGGAAAALLLCCCGIGGVGGWWLFRDPGDRKDAAAVKDNEEKKDLRPDFKLDAEALAKEFVADEKAGAAKYKDKIIEVTGVVTGVGPTLDQIMLKGAKKDPKDLIEFGVRLGIPEPQQAKCARLSRGQKVKAVGRYFSSMSGFWLTITDCKVTELEPSKTVTVPAEDLAREFEKDAAAAEARYKVVDFVCKGTIEDIRVDKIGVKQLVLKGTTKTRVICAVGGMDQLEATKGQTIEIRGRNDFFIHRDNELEIMRRVFIPVK